MRWHVRHNHRRVIGYHSRCIAAFDPPLGSDDASFALRFTPTHVFSGMLLLYRLLVAVIGFSSNRPAPLCFLLENGGFPRTKTTTQEKYLTLKISPQQVITSLHPLETSSTYFRKFGTIAVLATAKLSHPQPSGVSYFSTCCTQDLFHWEASS